jgi:hypothetical protein
MLVRDKQQDENPLLGFTDSRQTLSTEEKDLVERSEKKVKIGGKEYSGDSSRPVSYADIYDTLTGGQNDAILETDPQRKVTYKQSLIGGEEDAQGRAQNEALTEEEGDDMEDREFTGLSVVEGKVGSYECPKFILSAREEARIRKPWRQGLIVKLMGRNIGYKALETRLKQIWVRKGVISIIDLGKDNFLVYFTNEEDYTKALEDGPWLIYDHYLIAREWTPNFHPNNAKIEKAAVWVRISGLPI